MDFTPLYDELDAKIRETAGAVGLGCAPGCGACCRRPSRHLEASVDELVPLAQFLWEAGEAPAVLARAREAGADGWCVLYEAGPDGGPYPRGRCGHYRFRPLVCRLFGFSAFRDKEGRLQPTGSKVMQAADPDLGRRFLGALESGLRPPVASEWRMRMAEVSPRAAVDLVPLNEALVRAIERVGLVWNLRKA